MQREFGVHAVSVASGFEDTGFYVREARRTRPTLIVLGMGLPRQEQLACELRSRAPDAGLIVCGGAILDFLGGKVKRAPAWLHDARMDWTYRLCREPRRLFRRYVMGNPAFLMKVAAWCFARRSQRG